MKEKGTSSELEGMDRRKFLGILVGSSAAIKSAKGAEAMWDSEGKDLSTPEKHKINSLDSEVKTFLDAEKRLWEQLPQVLVDTVRHDYAVRLDKEIRQFDVAYKKLENYTNEEAVKELLRKGQSKEKNDDPKLNSAINSAAVQISAYARDKVNNLSATVADHKNIKRQFNSNYPEFSNAKKTPDKHK